MSSARFQSYLLPSLPFRRRGSSSASSSTLSSSPASLVIEPPAITPFPPVDTHALEPIEERTYLTGSNASISCSHCHADLALISQIVSKGFTGRYGRAYLVAPNVPSDQPISTGSLPNTQTHNPVPRQLVTGLHTVCDVSCGVCETVLGWKYLAAEEEAQQYKIGKFILESRRIIVGSCWEIDNQTHAFSPPAADDIAFDSQNEEECDELFAGVWTPQSARRRRARRSAHA